MKLIALALAGAVALCVSAAAQVIGADVFAGPSITGAPVGPALNFGLSPQQIQVQYAATTGRLNAALAGIAALPESSVDFANTVKAFESVTAAWKREIRPISFLRLVSPDPAVREAAAALTKQSDAYDVELSLREDLYRQFERAAAKGETLDPADKRLMDWTLKNFRDNGLWLAPGQREKLKAMKTRLGDLQIEFVRNIDEKNAPLIVDDGGIKGLPADFVATLKRTPDGRYEIPVDKPSVAAYTRYAESGEYRTALRIKFDNRGGERNVEILHEALGLRRDVARLLGYKGYPEMAMKDRMAGTPERVYALLNRVRAAVVGRARTDMDESRAKRDALDAERVRQYFPVNRVVAGTMNVYQKILGVTFRELQGGPKWAADVRLFSIIDAKSGKRIGHFYLDLTPRDGKFGLGAAASIISGRMREDGTYEEPVSAMIASFPQAAPGRPSLLTHADVTTFFHEFGHLMHQTLTTARYASFSGSSVASDFAEVPSKMFENFVWERAVLDELSGHWRDGSKMPQELFDKMLAARSFREGADYASQVALALGDLVLNSSVPDDVSAVFDKIMNDVAGVSAAPGTHFVGSFSHLMLDGYGAGYYSYLWSKVFAQDIYTLFKADGVISPAVGAKYRKEILEVGSERPEMESLRAFLGREPSEEAFIRGVRGKGRPFFAPFLEFMRRIGLSYRATGR